MGSVGAGQGGEGAGWEWGEWNSRVDTVTVRGVRYGVRRWGRAEAPPVILLHGWMDVSASFQFLVEALASRLGQDRRYIAPDWRGFGVSQWLGQPYYFPEYLGDLEALLDVYTPNTPVTLVGHSMGGIVATLYAGIRPARVRGLVNLEGFGLAPTDPAMAPERFAKWLDAQGLAPDMHRYPDRQAFARRLLRDNPHLLPERAEFLAQYLACPASPGGGGGGGGGEGFVWAGDPWHKVAGAYLFRLDESMAVWRQVTAPVLWVAARESRIIKDFATRPGDYEARRDSLSRVEEAWVHDAGHMLHIEQPEAVADLIAAFFAKHGL